MRVAFLDERFCGRERDDFESAATRGPGQAERRPAGAVGLVFVAQRGDGRGAPVPQMRRLLECFRPAVADQGLADAGEEPPPDRWKML
jgi:hypothetical protein